MRQNTSKGNGGTDKRIEFFITSDSELEMAWRDALDFEILGSVACKLENLSSQVFKNGSQIDAGFGTDARLLAREISEVTLYATARELKTGFGGVRFWGLDLGIALSTSLASCLSFTTASHVWRFILGLCWDQ